MSYVETLHGTVLDTAQDRTRVGTSQFARMGGRTHVTLTSDSRVLVYTTAQVRELIKLLQSALTDADAVDDTDAINVTR